MSALPRVPVDTPRGPARGRASRLGVRLRAAAGFLRGTVEAPPPVEVVIEVTNVCNLACVMCARQQMARDTGKMDLHVFRKVVDEAATHAELVYLAGGLGEPLAHPDLPEMVRYCRERGVRVGVSTNATLLDPRRATALLDAGPDIVLFSLDGATAQTHEAIRVGSDFERTMGRVSALLHEKARRGLSRPYTVVQMVTMPTNEHEADAFRARWQGHPGLDVVRFKKYKDLLGDPRAASGRDPHASCLLPWRQASVGHDGRLGLCCRDLDFQHTVGDVVAEPFDASWNGARMKAMRRRLSEGGRDGHPLCARCDIFESGPAAVTLLTALDGMTVRRLIPVLERGLRRLGRPVMGY